VAEGVENQETLDLLEIIDCDYAQGYLLSRPLPVEQITAWLKQAQLVA
jgi:EAL domain-containing protein (putative c-di-GMP-specific phosphodiesterase class I)